MQIQQGCPVKENSHHQCSLPPVSLPLPALFLFVSLISNGGNAVGTRNQRPDLLCHTGFSIVVTHVP